MNQGVGRSGLEFVCRIKVLPHVSILIGHGDGSFAVVDINADGTDDLCSGVMAGEI